ncbi:MmcQ/YjbR family DNA-binding protein [Dermacoccaceae bacterium W4C1]
MAHPQRFRDDDPLLLRVREMALAYPGADEKVSHGRPTFFTTRTFLTYGGTVKGDHADDRWARSVLVKPDDDERLAVLDDELGFLPAYVGASGWVGYDLSEPGADWGLVAELLDMSYRNTAPATLVKELDAR